MIGSGFSAAECWTTARACSFDLDRSTVLGIAVYALGGFGFDQSYAEQFGRNSFANIAYQIAVEREFKINLALLCA